MRALRGTDSVCVIGAGTGGFRVARKLRERGFRGALTVLGAEGHLPYDRVQLSKRLLLDSSATPEWLASRDEAANLGLDFRPSTPAIGMDLLSDRVRVATDTGHVVADRVVIACGARARDLFRGAGAGGRVLRTVDDCLDLRRAMSSSQRVVIVGGGFIGGEVSSAARATGSDVVMVEALPELMAPRLGEVAGGTYRAMQTGAGVDVLTNAPVASIRREPNARYAQVEIEGGSTAFGEIVLVAIGVVPDTTWLPSEFLLESGRVSANQFGVTSVDPRVSVLGDASAWRNPLIGRFDVAEHWTTTVHQADAVAAWLSGSPGNDKPEVPYAWSDQHGQTIQIVGWPHLRTSTAALGPGRTGPPNIVLYERDDVLIGAFAIGQPLPMVKARQQIALQRRFAEAIDEIRAISADCSTILLEESLEEERA